jgi:hypothetical protein
MVDALQVLHQRSLPFKTAQVAAFVADHPALTLMAARASEEKDAGISVDPRTLKLLNPSGEGAKGINIRPQFKAPDKPGSLGLPDPKIVPALKPATGTFAANR